MKMPKSNCVACNRPMYVNEGQPSICGDCEVCPKCGEHVAFRCSKKHNIYECEFCRDDYSSLADLEKDVREFWVARAKKILGLSD